MLVRRNQQKRCTEMGKPAQLQFVRGLCLKHMSYSCTAVQLYWLKQGGNGLDLRSGHFEHPFNQ